MFISLYNAINHWSWKISVSSVFYWFSCLFCCKAKKKVVLSLTTTALLCVGMNDYSTSYSLRNSFFFFFSSFDFLFFPFVYAQCLTKEKQVFIDWRSHRQISSYTLLYEIPEQQKRKEKKCIRMTSKIATTISSTVDSKQHKSIRVEDNNKKEKKL